MNTRSMTSPWCASYDPVRWVGRRHGPRRAIANEELISVGDEPAEIYEVLSCGHYQIAQIGADGDNTAKGRCCVQCQEGLPICAPGRKLW